MTTNLSQVRSAVCRMAYSSIQRRETDQSQAMRQAWAAVRLMLLMGVSPVSFPFTKRDGTLRRMRARRKAALDLHETRPDQVIVFDLDKEEIRSFCIDQLPV